MQASSGGLGETGRRRELMAFLPAKAQFCGRERHAGRAGQARALEAVCGFHAILFCSGFAPGLCKCPQKFSDGTCKVKTCTVPVDYLFQILFPGSFSVPFVPLPNTSLLSELLLWAPGFSRNSS